MLSFSLDSHALTDLGRKRKHNEDCFFHSRELCVLADGMGGRLSGEVASKIAVETIRKHFTYHTPSLSDSPSFEEVKQALQMLTTLMGDWIKGINRELFRLGRQESERRNMGTTIVVFHLMYEYGVFAHVGDSRIYRFRDDAIDRVTEDHSFLNRQVKANLMTEEEAARSDKKNIVTRALGIREDVGVDIRVQKTRPGDIFLLCSDGLTDLVEDALIRDLVLNSGDDLDHACRSLVDLANARGGKDNITVVLARVVG